MWSDKYIGLEFKSGGRKRPFVDCWGLVCLVYKEQLGIDLPCFDIAQDTEKETLEQVAQKMEQESYNWKPVKKSKDYDVLLLRVSNKFSHHIGIVTGNSFLHIFNGINSVTEPLNSRLWKQKITGFYRYADCY